MKIIKNILSVLNKIKNKFRKTNLYWKFRHLLNPKIWENYHDNFNAKRRDFYSSYIYQNNFKTIFEYGCASGPNLFNIDKNISWDIFYFGYDISKEAIKFANKKVKKETYFLTYELNKEILISQLNKWESKKFDLSIYDRVLYLLSEEEIKAHFYKYKNYFCKLVIDDFHNSDFEDKNEAYYSKNYEKILFDYDFKLIQNEPSQHIIGNDDFFKRSSRRLIFEKI